MTAQEQKTADISDCETYRYNLSRIWDASKHPLVFVGLNPSTADATEDDNTIRTLRTRARKMGFGGLVVVNLFAFRSKNPWEMKAARDPVGPRNDQAIRQATKGAQMVLFGWGTYGAHRGRDAEVRALVVGADINPFCLGRTKHGHPRHPLYISHKTQPEIY